MNFARTIGASLLSVALFLLTMPVPATLTAKENNSQMGDFEILDDPVKRYDGYPVGWIEGVANRIWLTHLAGSPLTFPEYRTGCVSHFHSISKIRKQLASLNIDKPEVSMLTMQNGSLLWPHVCKPVEMTVLSEPKNRVELVILQQRDFTGFLSGLISALKNGFPRTAMVKRAKADDLRKAYNLINPSPLPSHRPLVGYPYLESSGAGYWRMQYEQLAKSGLAQGNYKIEESEMSVRLTFDLNSASREGVE